MNIEDIPIIFAKAAGRIVTAAIVDIAYQYFTKPEINFYRTVVVALVLGIGGFIYDWKKKKQ